MYKTEYDRANKSWIAWYVNEDKKIEDCEWGNTKEDALVNLGWAICYKLHCKESA
jgi:hypothetical protein